MMMNRLLLLWLCAVLLAVPRSSPGQEQPAEEEPLERGGWVVSGRRYPMPGRSRPAGHPLEGIFTGFSPARNVRALLNLADTLWIGTDGGLFAYSMVGDTVFYVKGPLSPSIRSITGDDDGALWVGSDQGISIRFDDRWLHYTGEEHRFFERITDIVRGDNKMWISTYGNGCAYVMDDSLTVFSREDSLLDDRVLSVIEETPHSIWFGTASGLCRADTLRWESMRYGRRIPIGAIEDLIFDEDGNLFLAVPRQGVVLYNLGRVRVFGPRDGLPSMEIHAFSLNPMGGVWAAGKSGLSSFDGSGWIPFRAPGTGLGDYRFLSIHHDLEGNSFLGTDRGTVLIMSRDSVKELDLPQDFPEPMVSKIRLFDGILWFLAGSRIYYLKDGLNEIEPPEQWYAEAMRDLSASAGGELWIATRFGIIHYDGLAWEVFDRRQGLPTEYFNAVSDDNRGNIWFGTFDSGVLKFSGTDWAHYTEKNGLPSDVIAGLVVDGYGDPWVITGNGEMARFHEGVWETVIFPREETVKAEPVQEQDSLNRYDPGIRFLTGYDGGELKHLPCRGLCLGLDGMGNCMAARGDGVYRFTSTGWQVTDLPDAREKIEPSAVVGTSRGEIWLGTRRNGVFVLRGGGWIHVGSTKGLTDDRILSIVEDSSGSIWIGTKYGGITRFTPEPTF